MFRVEYDTSCHGQRKEESRWQELDEDCIQRKWPDVALDLVGTAEQ
jgi:hypothetical protein